ASHPIDHSSNDTAIIVRTVMAPASQSAFSESKGAQSNSKSKSKLSYDNIPSIVRFLPSSFITDNDHVASDLHRSKESMRSISSSPSSSPAFSSASATAPSTHTSVAATAAVSANAVEVEEMFSDYCAICLNQSSTDACMLNTCFHAFCKKC